MFSKRLRHLRELKKMTQKSLGAVLSAGTSTVAMWELGDRNPDHEMLVKIADYFDVSTDYLLGRDQIDIHINIDSERVKNIADLKALAEEATESLNLALADGILTEEQAKLSLQIFQQTIVLMIENSNDK